MIDTLCLLTVNTQVFHELVTTESNYVGILDCVTKISQVENSSKANCFSYLSTSPQITFPSYQIGVGLDQIKLDQIRLDLIRLHKITLDYIRLHQIGLDWFGLDRIGLDWAGLDWIGLDWIR